MGFLLSIFGYKRLLSIYNRARWKQHAPVVKLVDTIDLGSIALRRTGSNPARRTIVAYRSVI